MIVPALVHWTGDPRRTATTSPTSTTGRWRSPSGSAHFAFPYQFTEIPEDVVFTVEDSGLHVTGEIRPGHPARRLVEASRTAGLLVMGRRNRESRLGPHTGGVTRAVLHHCRTPVAVIPHD
ncbi:universal stress protein [Streptomyces erythrochromogenes]|uniref:universal stress protein n=1 Tax=Streptomyces erythrochromogenes TaxID=285574 RepID=UPI003637DCCB